ncbi:sensor histidine kinase [Cohnella xylanilytica]|uniref:histidine kinase n=1 Tax=Cohnella xylanilytica TaxID=557555 RepID=A0A841TZR2_9BACL|nr:sensor histidine kinase [Cohnella xylanilytica]MBB6692602.1 sensor histidine kinase [Cohnella xylanilytica]
MKPTYRWPKSFRPTNRMEGKLLIVFLFLIILPIGILSYVSALRYSNTIENNTVNYASQLSDKMMDKLDDYLEDMKKISIFSSYIGGIKDGLKISNRFYQAQPNRANETPSTILPSEQQTRIDVQKKIGNSLYFLNNIKSGTNSVYLFDRYGHVYYAAQNLGVRSDLEQSYPKWKELAYEANGSPVLVTAQEQSQPAVGKRYVFTVVRSIIDPINYEALGMIAVDANVGVIENIVQDLDKTTLGTTVVTDGAGQVIYNSGEKSNAPEYPLEDWMRESGDGKGSFHATLNGEHILTIYKQSARTGWKVLITIPEKHLMADANRTRNFTIAAAVTIMSFALLISLFLVFALTRPLRSLVRTMKEVRRGNLDVVFPVVRRDEIGLVGSEFNRMISQVKTLIHDIYAIEQRKKEAEVQSLQHQINPHFIYNTLESIRMTAVLNDDAEVGDMTQLLGKLLRYSIHAETETVPIEQEWEHLRMYVLLLNYRFGDRFVLELPPEEETRGIHVMKLLFQPIVENAVYHGFDEGKPRMTVRIRCRAEGNDLLFDVSDDGTGMDQEKLKRLRESLMEPVPRWDGRGIGLRNVNERLKLVHGEAYGLSIDSEPGEGTTVTARLPRAKNDASL